MISELRTVITLCRHKISQSMFYEQLCHFIVMRIGMVEFLSFIPPQITPLDRSEEPSRFGRLSEGLNAMKQFNCATT